MVLPEDEEASGSSNHYRPANKDNAEADHQQHNNANNDANNGDDDVAAVARRQYEQYENAARRRLFPDPNAPIGSQGDLSRQNEVNLLLEAAEERAKKYWNLDYDFFYSMPGDPLNVKWQREGMLPPELRESVEPHHRQIGPKEPFQFL